VVATNCASGPSEILADMAREAVTGPMDVDAGALVPTDDPERFSQALRAVHAEPRRTAAGAAARQRSLAYGVEQAAENYWARIERALEHRPRATGDLRNGEIALSSGVSQ